MNIELKDFQVIRTRELVNKFRAAVNDYASTGDGQAIALSAPTGSGKTVMAAAFVEQLLLGTEDFEGDDSFVFLWLTDQPQLNAQTAQKMLDLTNLDSDRIVTIEETFTDDFLKPGCLYFLNTQKLGANSSLVKVGGSRSVSVWEAIANTIVNDPGRFVLIIDEAHRGMKEAKADPEFATTIVQRFIKGSEEHELPSVPIVLGISATIKRFHDLIGTTSRTERKVEVEVPEVRASGLVKELTRLKSTSNTSGIDATMLIEATNEWSEFRNLWGEYAISQGIDLLDPILLVQVEDGTTTQLSKSPLSEILSTIQDQIEPENPDWLAHAFHTETSIPEDEYGFPVRFLAPSKIDSDPDVRVVLFKSSLNTGWDCPRAEVLVSFRPANDPTSIAQLIGRMVRARLAKRIVRYDVLNTALVFLPRYNSKAVKSIIGLLNGEGDAQTGSDAEDESEIVWLDRATGSEMDKAFKLLGELPSIEMSAKVKTPPIERLFRLAGLLAELSIAPSPVEDASAALVDLIMTEFEARQGTSMFTESLTAASTATILSHTHEYGQSAVATDASTTQVSLASSDLDDRFAAAERSLSSRGLANAYLSRRLEQGGEESEVKAEFFVLALDGSVMPAINEAAEALANQWLAQFRTQLKGLKNTDEDRNKRYKDLLATSGKPSVGEIELSEGVVNWPKGAKFSDAQEWHRHMYVRKDDGKFFEYLNSWERKVMTQELAHPDVVAWLRNVPRKSWSFRVVYQSGTDYTPFYPDFIVFRRNAVGHLEPSIVDPHLLNDAHAPQRAAGLAVFAADLSDDSFQRIDLIIVEEHSPGVETIKRLNLMDPPTRQQVAKVTSTAHLQALFDIAPLGI